MALLIQLSLVAFFYYPFSYRVQAPLRVDVFESKIRIWKPHVKILGDTQDASFEIIPPDILLIHDMSAYVFVLDVYAYVNLHMFAYIPAKTHLKQKQDWSAKATLTLVHQQIISFSSASSGQCTCIEPWFYCLAYFKRYLYTIHMLFPLHPFGPPFLAFYSGLPPASIFSLLSSLDRLKPHPCRRCIHSQRTAISTARIGLIPLRAKVGQEVKVLANPRKAKIFTCNAV